MSDVKNKIIGDAIVTTLKNVGISVLTADCVPILFYNPKKKNCWMCARWLERRIKWNY